VTETPSGAPPCPPGRDLLRGKTVLITAAAGTGIGYATAKRCIEEGATVFVSDLHERRLGEAVQKLSSLAAAAPFSRVCDVTKESDVRSLTDEQWNKVLDVSLTSVFRMTRAVLPHMYARRSGVIVNNASVLGWRAQALQAHYAAAKAGVMAFTRCAAIEAAEYGVRVNAVAPSIAMHEFLNRVTRDDLLTELRRREAFGRTAEVWEIANVIVFLAGDLSSYMTGEVISVSSQRA
jgi:3-oxoacyl-[acyl-carrier protein] reductase